MLTAYKFALAFLLLIGCGLLTINPILGVIAMIVAFLLFRSQQRREQEQTDERRHQEMIDAMKK